MKVLGLTGGISSGKSTVSRMLKKLGAKVIDADEIAHELAEIGKPLYLSYLEHFGEEILLPDKTLNRKEIAKRIYNDQKEREWIDNVSHPIIQKKALEYLEEFKNTGEKAAILEVPLLFETGWNKYADIVWVTYVSRETQIKRLKKRDRLGRANAEKRLQAQMPLDEKVKLADIVINNENSLEELQEEVEKFWSEFLKSPE